MSILRSSKFFRYFISFAKNIVVTRPREIDGSLIQRSLNLASPPSRFLSQAVVPEKNIDKHIQRLDQDVRRAGRISKKELEDVFKEIKHLKHATSTQSLMIIRCCGNLVPEESPEVRTNLVKEIWATLEKIGVPLDISHYNALLRVYLENEHKFLPTEFLADLQSKGVEPNRVTYQRLIAAYCQRGDIEGATQILEFMKQKQMPVNESVFNALINGHFQADDVESAVGILSVMKQANIVPSAETYTVLMCGYAKGGDIGSIKELLAQCEAQDLVISNKDILEVMYTLAVNNHTDLIDQLAENINHVPGYNQDAKNVILRLIVRGKETGALKILRTMKPASTIEGEALPTGNFLIKQMVKCNRPIENIVTVCKELKASGENENAIATATEAALIAGNPDLSRQLLSTLKEEQEVCQHYYWPVLVQYGNTGNVKGMMETLVQIVTEVGQPVQGETLRDYVAPYLPEGEEGVFIMRQGGVPLASAAAAMVGHLLQKNKIKPAARIALQFRAKYSSVQLCRSAVTAFIQTNDLDSFITLVRVISDSEKEDDDGSSADKIILDAVHMLGRSRTAEKVKSILEGYLEAGIGISSETAEQIQNILAGKELTQEISSLLSKLTSPDLIPIDLNRPELPRRQVEKDESSILQALNVATLKGENTQGLRKQLLNHYCIIKDLAKAEQLMKELEQGDFEFSSGSLVLIMDLYAHHEKLSEALQYYDRLFKGNPDALIDPAKILRLAALMMKTGMIQEATNLLEKHKIDPESDFKGFNSTSAGWRLLNSIAETKDVDTLKKVFNLLIENKYVEVNNIILGPLIKVHLLRDDIDSALNEFEECCRKYRATPWKNELACKLIQKEDPIALQRLTDLSTEIHGEINSLYDLVLSFIECGRIRQARKILETPGLRLRNQRINSACERYTNEGMVNHLESLVEATRDLNHIDRSDIYYHLLLSYCKSDDVDKAIGLWTQMQDEDVQPSEQFLTKLGQLLQKHNKPVPFALPNEPKKVKEEDELLNKQSKPVSSQVKSFRRAVNARDVEEAQNIMNSLSDSEFTNTDRSRLLNLLLANGRIGEASRILLNWLERGVKPQIRTLNFVINNLAKSGDMDTMAAFGKVLDKELRRLTSFSNRLTHCMVQAGRVNDVLEKLESEITSAKTAEELNMVQEEFPRGGIYSVLESSPESLPRLEEIAKQYRDKGILDMTNILWTHYYINGNTEKANEMWSHLKHSPRILLLPVLKHIRKNKDITLASNLLDLFKTADVQARNSGLVYSVLVDITNMSGDTAGSEKVLEEALKDCTIEEISRGTLLRLKRSVELEGKPFKYTIPAKRKRPGDTSSSSDSDSDSEESHARAR